VERKRFGDVPLRKGDALVTFIRDSVLIKDGLAYRRVKGDQDVVARTKAIDMKTSGDVRIEKCR
jgi:hypothetical protein